MIQNISVNSNPVANMVLWFISCENFSVCYCRNCQYMLARLEVVAYMQKLWYICSEKCCSQCTNTYTISKSILLNNNK